MAMIKQIPFLLHKGKTLTDALFSLSFFSVRTVSKTGGLIGLLKSIRMGIAFFTALTSQQKLTSHANNWGSVHDVLVRSYP